MPPLIDTRHHSTPYRSVDRVAAKGRAAPPPGGASTPRPRRRAPGGAAAIRLAGMGSKAFAGHGLYRAA